MRGILISIFLIFSGIQLNAQSCEEIMEAVKSENYGTTYQSYE